MKSLLGLLIFGAFTAVLAAETPAAILTDYQDKAKQVVERLNRTLSEQAATLAGQMVAKGDTAVAEQITLQVKEKTTGEPFLKPHMAAAKLFKQYDAARKTALQPLQQVAYAKIEAALKSAGKTLELVGEFGKVREAIETNTLVDPPKPFSTQTTWSFQKSRKGVSFGTFILNLDGTAELSTDIGKKEAKWKPAKKGPVILVTIPGRSASMTQSSRRSRAKCGLTPAI